MIRINLYAVSWPFFEFWCVRIRYLLSQNTGNTCATSAASGRDVAHEIGSTMWGKFMVIGLIHWSKSLDYYGRGAWEENGCRGRNWWGHQERRRRRRDNIYPGHSSVTGTSRNDFFPGCFLAPGFLSGQNRRIPIGSYRFQEGPTGDRLENYRNCPKTSDRNPAAKNQSKTARKRSEAAKTGGIRHRNRQNRPAFWGSGNWIDRSG